MRSITFITLFLLGGIPLLKGQSWLIQGNIENAEEGPVLLASFYGDRFRVVDSMDTKSGFFYFMLPDEAPPGIYRIIFSDRIGDVKNMNSFVEFIYNRENMEIFIASSERGPIPYFENSTENQIYSEFMGFELDYEERVQTVYSLLYPERQGMNEEAVAVYNGIQREREQYMDSITGLYPDLYAVRVMNAFRAPFIPGEISHARRIDTLKDCFFDQVPIDDPQLLYAPVYTFKLIDYLSLYKDNSMSGMQQEQEFIAAVDRIMVNVSREGKLREFVVEFLLEGFELLEMEQVQMYLVDNYLDESCESDIVDLVLSRMEGYKLMSPGLQAPDIVLRDVKGKNYQLSGMDHDYVLVLFWSSTCEACRDLLPRLKDWYLSENSYDLEVLAISIDTSVTNFEYLFKQMDPPWITSHDPLGWYGKVSSDYHVYASPSLFLLDRERTILARPSGFRQFLRAMKRLEN